VFAEDNETLVCDLTVVGQRFLLARAAMAASATSISRPRQTRPPRRANPGLPGEELNIWLRLKLIADAGLVGLPNAGKSTFLAAVTAAKRRLPTIRLPRCIRASAWPASMRGIRHRRHSRSDRGAHEGVGIGDRFLGHVERTRVLLHLVSAQEENPGKAYNTVRAELDAYGNGLIEKVEIVALSQVTYSTPMVARRSRLAEARRRPAPMLLSAVTGEGVEAVLRALMSVVAEARAAVRRSVEDALG